VSNGALSPINRGLARVPRRADQKSDEHLRKTFVDSGVTAALEIDDHQVMFGRRGTGKTHALRYAQGVIESQGHLSIYVDLRTVGSPEGLFAAGAVPETERTARLLVDLLGQVHEELLKYVLDNADLLGNGRLVAGLDALVDGITEVRVPLAEVEAEAERTTTSGSSGGLTAAVGPAATIGVSLGSENTDGTGSRLRELRQGPERIHLHFAAVAQALRTILGELAPRRVWLLLDEWSSVPSSIQPLLGEFLVRCVLPLANATVKIAAIEQQTVFRRALDDGAEVGIELGADVTANVNLDDFMVFEQNEDRARSFFVELLTAHLMSDELPAGVLGTGNLIAKGFKDRRAFDELVRAAEGVPRDAINIAAKAGMQAGSDRISVDNVRSAAQAWFTSDKEAALRSREEATALLRWVIDQVIRGKRSRGFLVNQDQSRDGLLLALFDARVLHVVRRGYSAQDRPGERFDVWVIDYGAYVDLISTTYEPKGLFNVGADSPEWVDVPPQDLRAIRRAILDLGQFHQARAEKLPLDSPSP